MYKIASILSLALVSAAASAAPTGSAPRQMADATQASPAASVASTTAAAPADKKICRHIPSSYSHQSERVCLTKEQWKQVDEQNRD
ncbi:MAG TPA: hypothetical protein VFW39_11780 [Sphingomicrobium sp.]|nr:hypothetical protein [Sphingomicrobium sp.]